MPQMIPIQMRLILLNPHASRIEDIGDVAGEFDIARPLQQKRRGTGDFARRQVRGVADEITYGAAIQIDDHQFESIRHLVFARPHQRPPAGGKGKPIAAERDDDGIWKSGKLVEWAVFGNELKLGGARHPGKCHGKQCFLQCLRITQFAGLEIDHRRDLRIAAGRDHIRGRLILAARIIVVDLIEIARIIGPSIPGIAAAPLVKSIRVTIDRPRSARLHSHVGEIGNKSARIKTNSPRIMQAMRLDLWHAAMRGDGHDHAVGLPITRAGYAQQVGVAERLEASGDGDGRSGKEPRHRIRRIETRTEQDDVLQRNIADFRMLDHPARVPVVDTDDATVGGSADAEEELSFAAGPLFLNRDIGDAKISLSRQMGDDGAMISVIIKGRDHAKTTCVAMGNIDFAAKDGHPADGAKDRHPPSGRSKGNCRPRG